MNNPPLICGADRYECQTLEEMQQHMASEHGVDNNQAPQWICPKDDWAHDIINSPGGQKCKKCNEFLDNIAIGFAQAVVATILERLLEQLPDETAITTKYGYHRDEKKYGYRLALADAKEAIQAELNKVKGTQV